MSIGTDGPVAGLAPLDAIGLPGLDAVEEADGPSMPVGIGLDPAEAELPPVLRAMPLGPCCGLHGGGAEPGPVGTGIDLPGNPDLIAPLNGSGDTTLSVSATGDQRIDGLIQGRKWADGAISYSDPDSVADYQPTHPEAFTSFQQINAAQLATIQFALDQTVLGQPAGAAGLSVEAFTGLAIDHAGSGSGAGTIRAANTSDPGTAYGYYPSSGVAGGDVFFGGSGRTPVTGNYHHHTVIHELGHALGLKHAQETWNLGAVPTDWDSMEFTLMTYRSYVGAPLTGYRNETWGYAQTWMMLDIAALQHLYGADFTANGGDTVYSWSQTTGQMFIDGALALDPGGNRIFATIWDGNGVDTYDLSNYTTDLSIDLAPGGYSVFSTAQLADLDASSSDPARVARGNLFNALLHQGDLRSLIENATGGIGNDSIAGNEGSNTLTGGVGDDTLAGLDGDDRLLGGEGSDVLRDGAGEDMVEGNGGDDLVEAGDAAIAGDSFAGGAGVDTISFAGVDFGTAGVVLDLAAGSASLGAASEAMTGFENLTGSQGSESIFGSAAANLLDGQAGDDLIRGLGGDDTITGGDGADTLNGGNGRDAVAGGAGEDRILGKAGDDALQGDAGNDVLNGARGADVLEGGEGDDILRGGVNGDTLTDGAGADTLNGGKGADLFDVVADASLDVVADYGDGVDLIRLAGLSFGALVVADLSPGRVSIDAAGDILVLRDGGLGLLTAADITETDFLFV